MYSCCTPRLEAGMAVLPSPALSFPTEPLPVHLHTPCPHPDSAQSAPSKACITGPTPASPALSGRLLPTPVKEQTSLCRKGQRHLASGSGGGGSATAHVPVSHLTVAPDPHLRVLSPQSSPTHTIVTGSLPSGPDSHHQLLKQYRTAFHHKSNLVFHLKWWLRFPRLFLETMVHSAGKVRHSFQNSA